MKSVEAASRVLKFQPREERRRGHELEFLPAALEIIETPASPVGRAVAITITLFAVIAITWAYFSHMDIISTATGKVVPTGRVKIIQPFETGVVGAIHVADGDRVKAGDVLVEIDPTINAAESGRIRADLLGRDLDIARLRALLRSKSRPENAE